MAIDNGLADLLSHRMGRYLEEAKDNAASLRAQAEQAEQVRAAWEEIVSHLSRRWILHLTADLENHRDLVRAHCEAAPEFAGQIDRLNTEAEDYRRRLPLRFPALLEQAAKEAALPIDGRSRHPRYEFDQGFFTVHVDDRRGTVRLSDREGLLEEMPADVGAVVQSVRRERDRVFGRVRDNEKFLRKLWSNYRAVLAKEGLQDPSPVPIRRITRRLGKNEKGFRTDEFLIDLSDLVQHGPLETNGWRLELQHTKDTSQGMLLHGAAGTGYVGFIVFRRI